MSGEIHAFDPGVGGGYRISLFYPPDENTFRDKSSNREDRVAVRFVELERPRKIVEAVNFETSDPAFLGEMTIVATSRRCAVEQKSRSSSQIYRRA